MPGSRKQVLIRSARQARLLPSTPSYSSVVGDFDDVSEASVLSSGIDSRLPRFTRAQTVDPEPSPYFEALLHETIPHREVRAVVVPEAHLVGESAGVVTRRGALVKESLWDEEHFRREFRRPERVARPHRIRGRAVALISSWDLNYYHFMADVLPRLAVLESVDLPAGLPVIVSEPLVSYQREMLRRVGVADDRLIPFRRQHVVVDELIWLSPPAYIGFMTPFVVQWVRERLGGADLSRGERRLYIDRGASRKVLNQEEITEVLGRHDFECVQPERLSVKDQIQLFSEARVVIATHGAGLANALFAKTLSVLELFQPGFINPYYYSMAGAAGWDYWYLRCQQASTGDQGKSGGLVVPTDLLDQSIREMLS